MNSQVDSGANGEGWEKAGWTLRCSELETGPVSFEDAISPEFFELEREAVFRRRWLMIGHDSDLPNVGSYFTKDLEVCETSIVAVRGKDGVVRAFHNICPHRGNKLVWNDFPGEETSGVCRQFTCKYHAWRYALDGELIFVQQESEFFDLDKADYPIASVTCEVWEGFIFVNFDPENTTSLRDYIVVSHRERRITVHARSEGGEWLTRTATVGGRVAVESLRVELSVDDIYSKSTVR